MHITSNIVWQERGMPPGNAGATHDLDIVLHHAVNLYVPAGSTTIDPVQRRTVESMRSARDAYGVLGGTGVVRCLAVHTAEDADAMPGDFLGRPVVSRTARDLPGLEDGPPLPLLFDLLSAARGDATPPPTHIVFTNADICLQPSFYVFVEEALRRGFDALVVNRRTIAAGAIDLPPSMAAAEIGEDHPGLDCFVFPVSLLDAFALNSACVGAGFVMRGLMHNLVALADQLLVLAAAHLTYHFGDERPWDGDLLAAHAAHNRRQDRVAYNELAKDPRSARRLRDFHDVKPKYNPPPVRRRK